MARSRVSGLPVGVPYYTVAEVAAHLRVAPMTIYRMVAEGRLPHKRIANRSIRIPAEEFRLWEEGEE